MTLFVEHISFQVIARCAARNMSYHVLKPQNYVDSVKINYT